MKINCSCLLDCALYASNISNYYDDLFLQKEGSCQMLSGVKFIAYFTFYLFFNGMWFPNCMHMAVFANAWFTPLGGCVVIRNYMC